jgi:hypothetical protein
MEDEEERPRPGVLLASLPSPPASWAGREEGQEREERRGVWCGCCVGGGETEGVSVKRVMTVMELLRSRGCDRYGGNVASRGRACASRL